MLSTEFSIVSKVYLMINIRENDLILGKIHVASEEESNFEIDVHAEVTWLCIDSCSSFNKRLATRFNKPMRQDSNSNNASKSVRTISTVWLVGLLIHVNKSNANCIKHFSRKELVLPIRMLINNPELSSISNFLDASVIGVSEIQLFR